MRALALAVLVAACAPRAFTPADADAIRAVITAQAAAWNRGDLAGYMAGYAKAPDLVFTSGGQIRHGWQETYDRYRARYGGAPSTMGHLDFVLLQIQPLGADGAIVLGRWKLDGPQAGSGVFSLALRRTPAGWLVVHDHTSLGSNT
ncbi:MAG TPA: DUF4440 domain-containing protein [Kofleriaceae bacterium]